MNVYVVSAVWWRDGASIIGAATDWAGAEMIADRERDDDPRVRSWTTWTKDIEPAKESMTWRRDALLADGTVHPSLSQEIVCVPLAGFIGDWPVKGLTTEGLATSVPALMKPKIYGAEQADEAVRAMGVEPVVIYSAPPAPFSDRDVRDAMHEAMETVLAARTATVRAGGYVDRIDVGTGAGLAYFQRAADTLPKMPDGSSWKVFNGDSIAGLRIVVDPDMRPDQIKIGSVIYTIGTGDNGIPEGSMIRVDVAEVERLTTEPD